MASNDPPVFGQKSAFETQRAALISEILVSFDHVLSNLNHLNRALEGVAAVGREFESIEALWSKFDDVLSRETAVNAQNDRGDKPADAAATATADASPVGGGGVEDTPRQAS